MKIAKNSGLAVLLFTLLFTSCVGKAETDVPESASSSQVNPVESTVEEDMSNAEPVGEETLTSILDRDGSDGYTGDLVLVYNPMLQGGSKPMGILDGLVETTENQVPTREDAYLQTTDIYKEEDPFLTDTARQADPCYDLENGDLWQIGFQRIFHVGYGLPEEMLFQVSAVGERCRVWSPVNPAYGPLEEIDPTYPEQLVQEMDKAIPVLEQAFGPIPDVRGDGKMNILCFDFNNPIALGFTTYFDIYEEISVNGQTERGNHVPIAYINMAPFIQGTYSKLSDVYTDVVHEMAHTIFAAQNGENGSMTMTISKRLLGEFLAVTAQEVVYPGSAIQHFLPWWYSDKAVWEDLAADDADVYLRDQRSERQNGKSIFQYTGGRDDYATVFLLACFAENRGSRELMMNITDYIDVNVRTIDIWEGLWKGLGYEDYPSFIEDFLLSILLHEEDGPYQLHPFEGYDPALWDGDENPFSHLKPVITDKGIYVGAGGYAVLRPVDDVYYPPATASKDLCYVGISWKSTE